MLNGTGTAGLAHRVSGELRSQGYSKATALNGTPPGANQVTVVEYASGHQAQAQGVARSLGVAQAQPIEGTVASLAGSATVVVIVGLDKASTSP
ncbi:MAG TPA: LytR C-terminal domain-containing protein [Solirubrobacteraceae bacterium]|nr:LytR C-terminal domain-containing protein [Solirubrobacteraceae bacterium]